MFIQIEVTNSTDISSGDIGFGYVTSGMILIIFYYILYKIHLLFEKILN